MVTERELKAKALAAYERRRWQQALLLGAAVAVLPLTSLVLGTPAQSVVVYGALLVSGATLALWRGGVTALGSATGIKAGLVPLVLAHASKLYGHVCTPGGCTTLCVPACAVGGVAAGLLIERWARVSERPNLVRGAGAVGALLTGALGCSCVGSSGVLALVVALFASQAAGRLVPTRE